MTFEKRPYSLLISMIESIRHRGLKRLYEKGDPSRIDPRLRDKVQRVLTVLEAAGAPKDMDLPGYVLHPLTGNLRGAGRCACRATGGWSSASRAGTPTTWI